MELRHLRYFKAIAERLNFSRAAEQLRVGQPALSRQIQDLERELGARLLDRTHTSVQLTDAGRTFYAHACKIVAQVDIATASVQQTLEGQGGELIICNDWRIPNQLVLGAIAEFRARYPQVEVTLRDLRIHEQLTVLRNRQAHLGFLLAREFAVRDSLQSMPLFSSNLMVVVGARHRLAAADSTRMAELADETWLTTSLRESPGWREYITQICRVGGYTPKFAKPVETVEAVLARVATGYGITLIPHFVAGLTPANPLVRFLDSDCPPIELCAVWHKAETSRLLRQFIRLLKSQLRTQPAASRRPAPRRAARNRRSRQV